MLEPLERFFRRVGCLILLDRAADPAANGHVQRNATHIKVFSGGAVRSLSDLHAQLHAAAHQPGGGDAMAVDAATTTGSLRTIGTGALQAMAGNTPVGGPAQATQAAIEAETNEDTYPPPDLLGKNLGVVKVYCHMTSTGTLNANSRNVASITKGTTGLYQVNYTTNFSNSDFFHIAAARSTTGYFGDMATPAVGNSGEYAMRLHDGVATNIANMYMAVGDQV